MYWDVSSEEFYSKDGCVLMDAMKREAENDRIQEMENMIAQIDQLPTWELLRLYDAIKEAFTQIRDVEARDVLRCYLLTVDDEIHHRSETEGAGKNVFYDGIA